MKHFNIKSIPYILAIAISFSISTSYGQDPQARIQTIQVSGSPSSQTIEVLPGNVGTAIVGISVNGATQGHILNYTFFQAGGNPSGLISVSGSGTIVGNSIGFGSASFLLNVSQTTQRDYSFIFSYNTNQGVQNSFFVSVRVIYRADFPCDGTDLTINENFSGTVQSFQAFNNLASKSKIYNSNITYSAGNRIRLYPGFHAKPGSNVIARIQGCSQNRDANKLLESVSSSSEIEKELKVTLFPNPTNNVLNVESNEEMARIEMMSQIGVLKDSKDNLLDSRKGTFNTSSYNTGVYFLKITFKDGSTLNRKVIKR